MSKDAKSIFTNIKGGSKAESVEPIDDTENIFDLSKLVGVRNEEQLKQKNNTITIDEQNKLLNGYVEVNTDDWDTIPKNTHVRYLRKDGNFRRGGFIKNMWVDAYSVHKGKKCIQLSASTQYNAAKWVVCHDDLDKIWKRIDSEKNISAPVDISGIQTNAESIEYLTKSVEQLKINISRLNNEQTRIINLIKKLHNIKSKTAS